MFMRRHEIEPGTVIVIHDNEHRLFDLEFDEWKSVLKCGEIVLVVERDDALARVIYEEGVAWVRLKTYVNYDCLHTVDDST